MALNIKDPVTERLAAEVAALAGESKTEAVRVALRQRRERLLLERGEPEGGRGVRRLLEDEIWPHVPGGLPPVSREEREAILGLGPDGV
ncbi:MAG TPA: type II toxin-antitoxin system VapB family antitoxin [Miltoncostaeaceae bacterium]|nr:type II toxin-antitoxin system VapB family antitoxin [Miltoncostaeaceae bacterium]